MRVFHSQTPGATGFTSDVLSGKERIIPFPDLHAGPVGRNTTARSLFALNFARAAFQKERAAKGRIDTFFASIAEHNFIEDVVSICDQWSSDAQLDITELYHLPVFKNSFRLDKTKYGPPSVMQLKLALREMQSCKTATAMIISRVSNITLCMKIPTWATNVFLVMDLPAHQRPTPDLSLVLNPSFEETVGRMSGILPIDNRLLSRDLQWQAQLTTSCAIHMLSPVAPANAFKEGVRAGVAESMALLRSWVDAAPPPTRHEGTQISGASSSRDQEDAGRSSRSQRHRQSGDRGVAGPSRASSNPRSFLARAASFIPYEQTKRHARIFFLDNLSDTSLTLIEDSDSDENNQGKDGDGDEDEEEDGIECGVCFENVSVMLGIHLDPCQHWLCISCITGHVCAKINERRFPVFCPLCMADRKNANPSQISGAFVQRLDVTEEQYAVWAELEMAQLSIQVHCRKCSQFAFVDKSDYDHLDKMTCPFPGCHHTWCKNCQQEISSNGPKHTCDGSSELKHLVKQMGWKHCPRCKTPVQKTGGCNHMTVSFFTGRDQVTDEPIGGAMSSV